MFVPVAAAAVVGALVMGATKPRTSCDKLRALGSRSGVSYEVEDFKSAGFIVVRAPDGSEGVFSRRFAPSGASAGFEWSRGRGNPVTLELMRSDFGVTPPSSPKP